jgi:uncharacterized protein YjlB
VPLLVYRAAVPADSAAIERLFAANQWPPAWRDGVHPFHHFHGNAHEVMTVTAGDVVVVPEGVGHCNQGQSSDLLIVGAHLRNAPRPDMHRGRPDEHDAMLRAIAAVALPEADPVAGANGPLRRLWGG